ncbi:MAG: hypothetical protein ACN6QH_10400 [Pseudomonas sp.]|uniref:hypothetical protein n=1 Tax=Pseudomonas sp. TaxID=306 RepID=UPI003D121742
MSSGGGSSPTPNRTCTGTINTNQNMWLVTTQPSINGGNWQQTPLSQVPSSASPTTVFIANGQTPNGQCTYQLADGSQFTLSFSMDGSNTANISGSGALIVTYNYGKTYPASGDGITVVYTLSNA